MVRNKWSKELKEEIKMYMANDWEVNEETPSYVLLKRNKENKVVHIILAILFWWLLFIPNILYHFLCKEKKKIMK